MSSPSYDVVTFGETMLRFTPAKLQRFEQADAFEVHIGGSESNTAVGLARLGLRVRWLSRLTDNPLGHRITRAIAQHNVDTSAVVWTPEDRVGIYYLEEGVAPRGSQVVYDRRGSAISRMHPNELPRDIFQPGQGTLFHTTGITMALSDSTAATAELAMELAKQSGWLVSFDLNYRQKLWTPTEALARCELIMQQADLVFMPLRDARLLYSLPAEIPAEDVMRSLAARFPQTKLIMTLGNQGSMACDGNQIFTEAAFPAGEVGRLGGGDAFSAGFLYSYLAKPDLATALRWGNAAAAMKYSIPGDLPLFTHAEVAQLIERGSQTTLVR